MADSDSDSSDPQLQSNLWTAASDGDLERVKELIEEDGMLPNAADPASYTALHAAASWARPEVLRYLVSKGGNIDVTDEDGETPLFACETREMAELCVELGADPKHANLGGLTAAQTLYDDSPHISAYLRTLTGEPEPEPRPQPEPDAALMPNEEAAASTLLEQVQAILARCDLDGTDPEPEVRRLIAGVVDSRVQAGRAIGQAQVQAEETQNVADAGPTKRTKTDEPER